MNLTDDDLRYFTEVSYYSSFFLTGLSSVALIVNTYLLNCSRYLRCPVGVNLRLCVTLTASDALCALFYILTYTINVLIPSNILSNCWSLLLEVLKLATFFASVFTLLSLALNHYVGIVYPLRRHVITKRTVKSAIALSFMVPLCVFFTIFCVLPGGFRAPIAFGFFSSEGCHNVSVLREPIVRWVLVAPFILVVLLLSFLYVHIIIHMGKISKDPLLTVNNRTKRSSNTKLLITLMLLAGSACIGWLPTTVTFVLTCPTCAFALPPYYILWMQIISQALNVLKLIVDAFIYASRLVEVRYSIWAFQSSLKSAVIGKRNSEEQIPSEFVRYLNETKENKSMRLKKNVERSSISEHNCKQRTTSLVLINGTRPSNTNHSMRVTRPSPFNTRQLSMEVTSNIRELI